MPRHDSPDHRSAGDAYRGRCRRGRRTCTALKPGVSSPSDENGLRPGAYATNAHAMHAYYAKGRPAFNPLIAHGTQCAGGADAGALRCRRGKTRHGVLARPLTLVLPKADGARADSRQPASQHRRACAHHACAKNLAASGAGRGTVGQPLRTRLADHGGAWLRRPTRPLELIVDGGATPVGVESTIVACLGEPMLLRPGGVPREAIETVLGHHSPINAEAAAADDVPLAPGMLASHYARRHRCGSMARVSPPMRACLRSDGARRRRRKRQIRPNLSKLGDLIEAAANLFSHLRALIRPAQRPSP